MQILSIQYLRAVAALMIVVFHAGNQLARLDLPAGWGARLQGGVDVFFVISGLIMWVTTAGTPARPGEFWRRRIIRVVPLYWIMTTAMVMATLLIPGMMWTDGFDRAHVVASYLFLPWPHPVLGDPLPILVPGWTLNVEMASYALFGLALPLPERARFWAVGGALAALVAATRLVPDTGLPLRFYGSDLVLEFWMGMALGRLHVAGRLPGSVASVALLSLGGAALLVGPGSEAGWPRALYAGVPATLLVLGALGLEGAGRVGRRPFALLLGESSYALYLSHVMVLPAVAVLWAGFPPGGLLSALGFVFAGVAASVAASVVIHRAIEAPLRRAMLSRSPGAARGLARAQAER